MRGVDPGVRGEAAEGNSVGTTGREAGLEGSAGSLGQVGDAPSRGGSGVGLDGVLDPVGELAEPGVDAGSVGLGAGVISPGHEPLQDAVADHGPPGITLRA